MGSKFELTTSAQRNLEANIAFLDREGLNEIVFNGLDIAEIEKLVEGNESLERLYNIMLRDMVSYFNARIRHAHAYKSLKFRGETYREQVSKTDRRRRQEHLAFVDSLNILSRSCVKHGKSNDWRGQLVNNEQIGEWAVSVVLDKYKSIAPNKKDGE